MEITTTILLELWNLVAATGILIAVTWIITKVALHTVKENTYILYQITLCKASDANTYILTYHKNNNVWEVYEEAQRDADKKSTKEGETWAIKEIVRV